jgi:hypothetical protein
LPEELHRTTYQTALTIFVAFGAFSPAIHSIVSKPHMQPCLYLRASIRGSAIPVFQMRTAHANAPASTHISLVASPPVSLILNLTHPRLVTDIRLLNTHQPRKIRISQTNFASDLDVGFLQFRVRDKSSYHLAPSPEVLLRWTFDISSRIRPACTCFRHQYRGPI